MAAADGHNHWTLLGAGAMGCLWAAYLRRCGFTVTLLTRRPPRHPTVTLITGNSAETFTLDAVDIEHFLRQPHAIERLLITTKSHQTLEALRRIDTAITSKTQLVVLQNGLASRDVALRYPDNPLVVGITTDGAYLDGEQRVVHSGIGVTHFGRYDGAPDHGLLDQLPTQYLAIEWTSDIATRQWQKLAVNCAINGLTAIYRCRNGALLDNSEAMQRIQRICEEARAVAAQLPLPGGCLDHCFLQTEQTLRGTASNYSSMYKDIEQGRKTEIDYLNGYLCREGERLGIACPENSAVVSAIRELEVRS